MPRTADFKEKGSSVSTARATRLVLTNRHLRGLKPTAHAQDFYDVQQRGLIARILPSAIVPFSVRYRFQGEQKRLKLGAYPAVSLQAAQTRTQYAGRDRRRARPGWRTTCGESRANGHVEALAADYLKKARTSTQTIGRRGRTDSGRRRPGPLARNLGARSDAARRACVD